MASDGTSLRVYQAVLDARALLAEISGQRRKQVTRLPKVQIVLCDI